MENSKSPGAIDSCDSNQPCVSRDMIRGSLGFGIVGLAAFSVWAFGGKWLQAHLGETGLYAACALAFLGLSGLLLHPLVRGPGSLLRFYTIFIPAFFCYALIWSIAWFLLHFGIGEWLGALAGAASFVAVVSWRLGNHRDFIRTSLIAFALNSAGYFLGGKLLHWLLGPSGTAMLSGLSKPSVVVIAQLAWGLLYGLGFGAGIGYVFHTLQKRNAPLAAVA